MKTFHILFISTLLFSACSNNEPETTSPEAPSEDQLNLSPESLNQLDFVKEYPVQRSLGVDLLADGMISVPPEHKISYTLPLSGRITAISLISGMQVKKGQLLLEIENPEFLSLQQNYVMLLSDLKLAETQLRRQEELSRGNANAQKDLDQAENQYTRIHAQVKAIEKTLLLYQFNLKQIQSGNFQSATRFYADKDYWITEVLVNMGSFARSGDVLIEMMSLQHQQLELQVFEKDMMSIQKGQTLSFQLPGEIQERLATVQFIGKEIGPNRSIKVICKLPAPDESLIPGSYVKAKIHLSSAGMWSVPATALQQWEGKSYVFIQQEERQFKLVEIPNPQLVRDFLVLDSTFSSRQVVTQGAFALLARAKNKAEE